MAERTIADVGRFLQNYGLNIGEHPEFGGVTGGHATGSFHYQPGGQAIDVRDWRPDIAPAFPGGKPISWKQRTGELSWRAKQLGAFEEVFGPGNKGHETHVHLALPGKASLTDQQLEWLATGRWKTPEGKLTDVMPGTTQQNLPVAPQQQPAQSDAPESINIYIDPSVLGQQQEEQPKDPAKELLSRFVENMYTRRTVPMPTFDLGKSIAQMPKVNYFA